MKQYRVVWERHHGAIPQGMHIHHINSNKKDNRITNLTLVTHTENMRKYDRVGKGYRHIKRNIARPYRAIRRIDGKQHHLGYYGTPCGAIMASRMFFV